MFSDKEKMTKKKIGMHQNRGENDSTYVYPIWSLPFSVASELSFLKIPSRCENREVSLFPLKFVNFLLHNRKETRNKIHARWPWLLTIIILQLFTIQQQF